MTTTTTDHGGIESEFSRAERLLVRRVESAVDQLNVRLEVVRSAHDLTWRGLLSEQRKVNALRRAGVAPSSEQFWRETALPMTELLRSASRAVIDEEFARVNDGVAHLLRAAGDIDPTVTTPVMTSAVMPLRLVDSDQGPLDRVGERWQRQLRAAAVRRVAVPLLVSPARETRERVLSAELDLLSRAPWMHGDRLLSAYEAAHSEIRTHLRNSTVSAMAQRPDGPNPRAMLAHVASHHGTITLR